MSHAHRDDFDVVAHTDSAEPEHEAAPAPTTASNALAARDAEVARAPIEREHAFTVGGDDVAATAGASIAATPAGDRDERLRRSGVPVPRYAGFRDELTWVRPAPPAFATLRIGDDWLDTYGAPPAQLAEAKTKWTSDR